MLVDKLVGEYNKEIYGNQMIYDDHENVCNSFTKYILLFVIVF